MFDDERVVANAGVLLPAVLAERLGIEAVVDRTVDLGDRAGAANAGRKVMSLVSAMYVGADCIDDCSVLRSGQTRAVLGHRVVRVMLGSLLRAFTFGHVRQLDKVLADCLSRAWAVGAGPGEEDCLWMSIRSSVRSMAMTSRARAMGTPTRGGIADRRDPLRDGRGVAHPREKGLGEHLRGALRFVEESIPGVGRAGASGPKLLRADSGFWNAKIMARLQRAGWTYSIGVRQQKHIKAAIAQIPEQDWQPLEDYPEGGEAQIAQTMLGSQRLIVRRTRLVGARMSCGPTGGTSRS